MVKETEKPLLKSKKEEEEEEEEERRKKLALANEKLEEKLEKNKEVKIIKNEEKPQSNAAYSPPKESYKNQASNFGSLLAAQEPTSAVKLAKNVGRKVS